MFDSYCRINDDTNAITYGKELVVIYCKRCETVNEGNLIIKLAQISEYDEAKELNERAVAIK